MTRFLIGFLISVVVAPTANAQHDGHHNFPPGVMHFHELMAPLVHAPPSPERAQKVCQSTEQLNERAIGVTRAPAPDEVSSADWSQAAKSLSEATKSLLAACANNDFKDRLLADVGSRFHQLVRLVGHDH